MKINQILPQEADFTEVLAAIALVPKTLYFYGKLPENVVFSGKQRAMKGATGVGKGTTGMGKVTAGMGKVAPDGVKCQRLPVVAIVGARKNTSYGAEVAYRAAYEAAKAGAVVVSGLAYGIDSIAHRGALDAGGLTVAVLGTPIDQIYPRQHQGLAEEIVASGGVVISEYAPGVVPEGGKEMRARFLMRNRLIAGLSDVVMVAEAAEKSGSLNTATHALEQGRDLLVVPGNINRPMSQGCNKLIRQGAMPYTEPDDLLNLLFPASPKVHQRRLPLGDNPTEVAIIKMLDEGVNDGEEIIEMTGLGVAEFNQAVTLMEIRGIIRSLGANRWCLR